LGSCETISTRVPTIRALFTAWRINELVSLSEHARHRVMLLGA
jgi:hypothetical protein